MKFKWTPVAYGYHINAYVDDKNVSEILLWGDSDKQIRMNWMQTEKKEQHKGYGKAILNEVKKNLKNVYPNAETLVFSKVTSLEMLRLIMVVFEGVEKYVNTNLPDWLKAKMLTESVTLPEKSPAKYDLNGNAKISKNAQSVDFYCIIV